MNRSDDDIRDEQPTQLSVFALIRRAVVEFMAVPILILVGFLVLAVVTLLLDSAEVAWLQVGRQYVGQYLFSTPQATSQLLETLVTGLLTVVSITFSILLLAVQQTANTLTNQVYDQFLRRRINQIYFGYFVGLVVYVLIILAAVAPDFNPVYSTACVFLLTTIGQCLLILLIYSTIDQMRPSVIIHSIHDHTLLARHREESLLRRTRRVSQCPAPTQAQVRAKSDGFVVAIKLDNLADAIAHAGGEFEVVVRARVGSYVAFDDILAEIKAERREVADRLVADVRQAVSLEREPDIQTAPAVGILQLETIGWTTTSSAKSTPEPARLVIDTLRDLLSRWAETESEKGGHVSKEQVLPVVYEDLVFSQALDAMATIATGTGESMQHVVMAKALHALAQLFGHLPRRLKLETEDLIRRLIPTLNNLTLTRDLDAALAALVEALREAGAGATASQLVANREQREESVGRFPE